MNLTSTYYYLSGITEPGPGWVLVVAMRLFSTIKVCRLIAPLYVIQKISVTNVAVQPIIYRRKFTVFQRGAVNLF
jgi:hypothetical protein